MKINQIKDINEYIINCTERGLKILDGIISEKSSIQKKVFYESLSEKARYRMMKYKDKKVDTFIAHIAQVSDIGA